MKLMMMVRRRMDYEFILFDERKLGKIQLIIIKRVKLKNYYSFYIPLSTNF